jgi:hypothetical protein
MGRGRYVLSSSTPMHWIGLEKELPGTTQLCSPEYGPAFLEQHMDTIIGHDGVLAVFFDQEIEHLLHRIGVPICFPLSSIRDALEDKCEAVRMAMAAGVRLLPTKLAKVNGYDHLRHLADHAGIGPKIIVQIPQGNSGKGTFLIRNEADYKTHARLIESAKECRLTQEIIHPQSLCIETVMTDAGTVIGMPALDLIGIPELTPNPNGWCGNVIGNGAIAPRIVREIREASLKIAAVVQRRHPGYFGYSGDDYLLCPASDHPMYQEKNARCTGMMPLSNVAAFELGLPPLIAQHIAQYEGEGARLDVEDLNRRWSDPQDVGLTTCLILKQLDHLPASLRSFPQKGLYSLDGGGLRQLRDSIAVRDVMDHPGFGLWVPETTGHQIQCQDVLGRLLVRDHLTDGNRLNPRGKAWIQAFREAMIYGS